VVGRVVLIDVSHICGRLDADLLGHHDLHVVEPDIGVESAGGSLLAHLRDVSRSGVIAGKGE
jgi:hypothetical protein